MADKIKVEICMGTTCYVLGSFRLSALEEQLPDDLKPCVEVVGCSCLNACQERNYGNAPFVRIGGTRLVDNATIEKVIDVIYAEFFNAGGEA